MTMIDNLLGFGLFGFYRGCNTNRKVRDIHPRYNIAHINMPGGGKHRDIGLQCSTLESFQFNCTCDVQLYVIYMCCVCVCVCVHAWARMNPRECVCVCMCYQS